MKIEDSWFKKHQDYEINKYIYIHTKKRTIWTKKNWNNGTICR